MSGLGDLAPFFSFFVFLFSLNRSFFPSFAFPPTLTGNREREFFEFFFSPWRVYFMLSFFFLGSRERL